MFRKIESFEYDFQGDVFVDIGGNVGMWTNIIYNDYKKIIFIEPSLTAIEKAKTTVNDINSKVQWCRKICSDIADQKKSIYTPNEDTGMFTIYGKELYKENDIINSENDIETVTLDSFISEAKEGDKVFVKIDTEGSDLDVIIGGQEFIKKFKPTLAIEFHFHMHFDDEKYEKVVNFMNDLGYQVSEFKFSGYISEPDRLFDGKHNGEEMYDMHYHVLAEPTQ